MRPLTSLSLLLTLSLSLSCEDPRKLPPLPRPGADSKLTRAFEDKPEQPSEIPAPPDVATPPEDAEKAENGLASKVLKPGSGTEHPRDFDSVKVHYSGWTTDGRMFDSSVARGTPITFGLKQVIPGWTQGLKLMVAGEKRRLWIPEELAYAGVPGRPQGMLVFDVELLEIVKGLEPRPAPADVAAPPNDAKKTASGLAYKFLSQGKGKKVGPTDVVKAQYTGWTADGTMFDTSYGRGRPANFPVNAVIPGWREGLQLMREGDRILMWVPEALAYAGREGAPKGMLVFEMEVVEVSAVPEAPADVNAPPKDAIKTEEGLIYRILTKGKGAAHPAPGSTVVVHYTGWTSNGKMFESSLMRGLPAAIPVDQLIPGWRIGLQKMVAGDKARFWVPEGLAYQGTEGHPKGTLVFDVELLEIK